MRIMLGVIAHSTVQPATAKALDEANRVLRQQRHTVSIAFIAQESLISRARDAAAAQFLNSLDDMLVTVDSDIVFRAADVLTLLERDVAVVCANYARKKDGAPAVDVPLGEYVPSQEIALGLAAIRREAFENMIRRCDADPLFPLDYYPHRFSPCVWGFHVPFVHAQRYLSETEAFAHRLRRADVELYVDGTLHLGHISKKTVGLS